MVSGRKLNLVFATPSQLKTDVWSVFIIGRVNLLTRGCQSCFIEKCRLQGDIAIDIVNPLEKD